MITKEEIETFLETTYSYGSGNNNFAMKGDSYDY